MATKLFCDRCDTEAARVHEIRIADSAVVNSYKTVELCNHCRDALVRWLSEAPALPMRRGA